jgi:hypothetical protein
VLTAELRRMSRACGVRTALAPPSDSTCAGAVEAIELLEVHAYGASLSTHRVPLEYP